MPKSRHCLVAAVLAACGIGVFVLGFAATAVVAGPDKVEFPANYVTDYVRYTTVDKIERKPPIIRFFYVNPEALAASKAGAPLPDGTVLVMEDHKAKLDSDGNPVMGPGERLIPTPELTTIFVQEKRAGWGAEYPAEKRNGEWEYAQFLPDGSHKPDVKIDRCFECHKAQEAEDYNFTFTPFVEIAKP